MSEFVISGCSTADLTKEYFQERDIHYVCFHFELDGKSYPDDLGETMSFEDFYRAMEGGAMTRTSQVNVEQYTEFFESFLKAGKDVLHLCLSSGISGTVNSARIAQEELKERYPDRKLYVVDSLAASSGFGLLLDKLADLRDEGRSVDELYEFAEAHKKEVQHWFFTSDLTYLIRGGRVSKTAGFIGKVMNICPLLNVDYEGRLISREKIRTKKRVIARIAEKMEELAVGGADYDGTCFISNSACPQDAEAVADAVVARMPKLKGKIKIFSIGTTIGSHTGPGTVALFFWGSERVD